MKRKLFSEQLRDAVRNSGRTSYSLAKELQTPPSTVWRFAKGKAGLSLALLDRLAEALDLYVVAGCNRKGG